MTDFELSQLRQDLMEQFNQMMADELPTGQEHLGDSPTLEWSPKN
ncbi:MAG: hypothetical protein QOF20_966 [Acidimicrobiaceae bacterium]|jgi:hypothetical protein|nr:hypothetical protein [Acidimicrobiaceae bacterium]MDQ1366274.1 hypothetical protein [Acidimicrobiaceae bacterium]MDQ1368613.1 hypothetical protein [Acidimicrobiaceae bacterium]MDQ1376448.1 hypothetical protein [Acidimicrobiaceae bacterium]MDQ1398150.1 hypothetical protein [Acidimicrobiaceae bacterium]